MTDITLVKCSDGAIWVTSDEDQNGTETMCKGSYSEEERFLVALIDFLEMTPTQVTKLMKEVPEWEENEGQCSQYNWGYDK